MEVGQYNMVLPKEIKKINHKRIKKKSLEKYPIFPVYAMLIIFIGLICSLIPKTLFNIYSFSRLDFSILYEY